MNEYKKALSGKTVIMNTYWVTRGKGLAAATERALKKQKTKEKEKATF